MEQEIYPVSSFEKIILVETTCPSAKEFMSEKGSLFLYKEHKGVYRYLEFIADRGGSWKIPLKKPSRSVNYNFDGKKIKLECRDGFQWAFGFNFILA